jgi:syntaxin 18
MLASIRKPYLNVDFRHTNPFTQSRAAALDLSAAENTWANIKHLTNNERDQIDIHARTILSKCADRVKNMEIIEKRTYKPFDNTSHYMA